MTFLQPAMLWAIPLIALPILIHLLNQRRYQTTGWGAMAFLLAANRMSQGHARLRQWLILAARMMALLGLLLVLTRPLASGWLGLASGTHVDTAIVVLDRSPSMGQIGRGGRSKHAAALARLSEAMEVMPPRRVVLMTDDGPLELPSPDSLSQAPETRRSDATTNMLGLLERVVDYVNDQQLGSCDVWICSDLRRSDWQDESQRWRSLRGRLRELPATVRFHLLAYPEAAGENRAIRVTGTRRVEGETGAELLLSLRIEQPAGAETKTREDANASADGGSAGGVEGTGVEGTGAERVAVGLLLDGARSEFLVELDGQGDSAIEHRIPLDPSQVRGWGEVSLAADANPADDRSYFVYDRPPERRTLIVAEDPQAIRPLQWVASIAPEPSLECSAEVVATEDLLGVDWDLYGLVLWQAPLPAAEESVELEALIRRGGRVIFFPPREPDSGTFAGLRWTQWREHDDGSARVVSWRGDQDLLAETSGGSNLPVGQLEIMRSCGLTGWEAASANVSSPDVSEDLISSPLSGGVALATLSDGEPLLVRASTQRQNVYFCTTTAAPNDSTLEANGVVLYAMIQRAAGVGAMSLGSTQEMIAGELDADAMASALAGEWTLVAGDPKAVSARYSEQAGVYRHRDRLIAVNRPRQEDETSVVPAARMAELFDGVAWSRVDDVAGSDASLVREIWRLFLVLMVVALLIEAALSLPKRTSSLPKRGSRGSDTAVTATSGLMQRSTAAGEAAA